MSLFFFFLFFSTKWLSLSVEGLLSMGPTPSSLMCNLQVGPKINVGFLVIFLTCLRIPWSDTGDGAALYLEGKIFLKFWGFLIKQENTKKKH